MTVEQTKTENVKKVASLIGLVTSVKGDKTIHIRVDRLVKHPKYGKYVRRTSKLAVHDPANSAKLGDMVEIVACRRLSRTKSWRMTKIVIPAAVAQLQHDDQAPGMAPRPVEENKP
ncbi:MAG: 30S ribosomal protein S17 [Planctomycetes bacterium]|nr:30S ribosomal protein S17 [Planctomycetota bacterium]